MARAKPQPEITESSGLPMYEGRPVVASRITIPGLAGGLREALDIDPIAIRHGEEGLILVRWSCRDVDHPPYKGDDVSILAREHALKVVAGMILRDDEQVTIAEQWLTDHHDQIVRKKDSMTGQTRTDDDEIPDEDLTPEEREARKRLKDAGIG